MSMSQENMPTSKPIIKFSFALVDLADSQTGTAVPILGGVVPTHLMPLAGWIVGYSINKSASHSAGSLDFDLTVAGTSTLTIAADTTDTYALLEVPNEPFAAGDALGVTYTSDGDLEANTVDVVVDVYVVFSEFRF
jgi:hypothetical protein